MSDDHKTEVKVEGAFEEADIPIPPNHTKYVVLGFSFVMPDDLMKSLPPDMDMLDLVQGFIRAGMMQIEAGKLVSVGPVPEGIQGVIMGPRGAKKMSAEEVKADIKKRTN